MQPCNHSNHNSTAFTAYRWISAISYAVLPVVVTFGASWTPYQSLFRPVPYNGFYDAMLVAVCFSVTSIEMLKQIWRCRAKRSTHSRQPVLPAPQTHSMERLLPDFESQQQLSYGPADAQNTRQFQTHNQAVPSAAATAAAPTPPVRATAEPIDAYVVFQLLLALVLGILYGVADAWGSAALWLAAAAALSACLAASSLHLGGVCSPAFAGFIRSMQTQWLHLKYFKRNSERCGRQASSSNVLIPEEQQQQQQQQIAFTWSWSFAKTRTPKCWAYSCFLCIIAAAFLAFPVARSWAGPPEPFVRWHPYSTSGELVWRGVFAVYAVMMLWAGVEDPLDKHWLFACYLGVSGFSHASVMLAMNLWQRAIGGPNGNVEHLYGDIAGWYVIAAASLLAALDAGRSQPLLLS